MVVRRKEEEDEGGGSYASRLTCMFEAGRGWPWRDTRF